MRRKLTGESVTRTDLSSNTVEFIAQADRRGGISELAELAGVMSDLVD